MILLGKIAIIYGVIAFALIAVAATIVLSLISLYIPNESVATSGIELQFYV